jgi:PIF1 helicase.
VVVLFSGDFRQILPVITRWTRADEVNALLKRSSSKDNRQFSIDLLQEGNGVKDFITLNNLCVLVKDVEELTEKYIPILVTYPLCH